MLPLLHFCVTAANIRKNHFRIYVRLMDFKQGLDRTNYTPIVLKAELCIKLKVIMSSFVSRLTSGRKSVAPYGKIGR